MVTLNINNRPVEVDVDGETPLLWVLRDHLELTGSKYGCGIGQCGACSVMIDGVAARSCSMPVSALSNTKIVTIEGLTSSPTPISEEVQKAWDDHNVPQCGYCQAGQIVSATAFLSANNQPSDEDINQAMAGNLCRCGTYPRIKQAIKTAVENIND